MTAVKLVVRPCVYSPVYDVTSYGGGDGGAIELNLTNSADIDAWIAKYSGSYTRASTMMIPDYLGVYHEIAINEYGIYGGRYSGGEWYNTEPDETPLAEIGMAFWPSTTNVVASVEYRDFTHANWTATNGSITAGAVTLIDGSSVSDKNTLTASGADCTLIKSAYTSASGTHAGGFFVKRKTGTGDIFVTVDNGTTWVNVTSEVDSDWNLIQTSLTVTNPQIGIKLATSGDEVYVDWAQIDDGSAYVSVYPIEGGATLASQNFYFADGPNTDLLITDTQGAIYAEFQNLPDDQTVNNNNQIATIYAGRYLIYSPTILNRLAAYDGTNAQILTGGVSGYTKAATYWSGSTMQISGNGASSIAGNYDGSWNNNHSFSNSLGSFRGTQQFMAGIINKAVFYPNQSKTQAEMEALTT